jgi:hypothetical protein
MIKHFYYRKKDNKVTERFVHPMGLVGDKLFAVDLTEFDTDERTDYEAILNHIHNQYVQAIKEAGLGENFRYFFFEGIEDV